MNTSKTPAAGDSTLPDCSPYPVTTDSTAGRTASTGFEQSDEGSSILKVRLEEVGARHWWMALLATLASQSGNAYMRFVGVVDKKPAYFSATFPVPRVWGSHSPTGEVGTGHDSVPARALPRDRGRGLAAARGFDRSLVALVRATSPPPVR